MVDEELEPVVDEDTDADPHHGAADEAPADGTTAERASDGASGGGSA